MIRLIIFILLITFSSALPAQEGSLSVDRQTILIGEPLRVQLEGRFPSGVRPSWESLDTIAHFEIMERGALDSATENELVRFRQSMVLTSWDSGSWQLPRFGLRGAEPVKIEVGYTPMDPAQPYNGIKDILSLPKDKPVRWYWAAVFLLVLIVLFLLFFPRSKAAKEAAKPVGLGAYRDALQQLAALRSEAPEPKIYFTQLVFIFREYLHRRRGILSHSKTSEDLAAQMRSLQLPPGLYGELVSALQLSDMAKFAKYHPSAEEISGSHDTIATGIQTIESLPHAV